MIKTTFDEQNPMKRWLAGKETWDIWLQISCPGVSPKCREAGVGPKDNMKSGHTSCHRKSIRFKIRKPKIKFPDLRLMSLWFYKYKNYIVLAHTQLSKSNKAYINHFTEIKIMWIISYSVLTYGKLSNSLLLWQSWRFYFLINHLHHLLACLVSYDTGQQP